MGIHADPKSLAAFGPGDALATKMRNQSLMQKEICRRIGVDPSVLTPPDEIGFGSVLSRFIDSIISRHDLVPWSRTSFDDIGSPDFETEDDNSYRFCGVFYTLGGKADWEVPVRLNLKLDGNSLNYELWIGCLDETWANMSESKRWKKVYRLCREELAEPWQWQHHVNGSFEERGENS